MSRDRSGLLGHMGAFVFFEASFLFRLLERTRGARHATLTDLEDGQRCSSLLRNQAFVAVFHWYLCSTPSGTVMRDISWCELYANA